jgi:hypothetical protein
VITRSSLDSFREVFLAYAGDCHGYSPLYEHLSTAIARDAELLEFSTFTRAGQPPPNLLFAAVHYLLLQGCDHPLMHYFASVTPQPRPPEEAWPHFRNFCLEYRHEIRALMSSRLVQTNEVGRSACLLPAFNYVSRLAAGRPLALIDVGASAGLNLLLDRFFIDYGRFTWGDPASPVRLSCELRGDTDPPLPAAAACTPGLAGMQGVSTPDIATTQIELAIGYRAGIDINPIDVAHEDALLWLRALVWPEHHQRARDLIGAAAIARSQPPLLILGDAVEILPGLLESIPPDLALCLYHSFTLHQLTPDGRERLYSLLREQSRLRDTYLVGMSGRMQAARLSLNTWWSQGQEQRVHLADCMAHGKWLRWLAD